jgi:hypothetical protein
MAAGLEAMAAGLAVVVEVRKHSMDGWRWWV